MAGGTKQKFPRWWQALIIIASGIAIGLSSCAAFLNGLDFAGVRNSNQQLSSLFVIGFLAGIAIALAGFVLLLIAVASAVVNGLRPPAALPALTPEGARVLGVARPAFEENPEQRVLRQFQMVLVVFMLLPAASVATSVLALLARLSLSSSLIFIALTYVLSQAPYAIALARTRRGPDRLGIAIAFAASCTMVVVGLLPFVHATSMFTNRLGLFAWPSLFLVGHVVVAVYAWRAGKLAPPEGDDLAVIAGSFAGVVAYLVLVRFVEASILPHLLRNGRLY